MTDRRDTKAMNKDSQDERLYTAKDMEAFAEWVVKDGWKWSVYIECFTNNLYDESMKTITQLREHWEKGRRVK